MASLIWLDDCAPFPDPDAALPEGLLAVGASLTVERLTQAYRRGIFPWFNDGDPILWWSPNPRMVLACNEFRASHSLSKKLRQIARSEGTPSARIRITTNLNFAAVIHGCAEPRGTQHATWISPAIQAAYTAWHHAGAAHSIETWIDGELAGGLYGVCLGRFFFGESMFSRANDASKIAVAYLIRFLSTRGISHIDCQQQTGHLASLGAHPVDRKQFLDLLNQALQYPAPEWGQGEIWQSGQLARYQGITR
ncbi:leucyl/phenylalanyl-tRNA--protein transferase [Pollutimonas harenae]|uniref:Leucyl/phenylalanyl-tRNA--protein transferase n=1 Tax=Pollutimonas harenae TaxID=657015 RepID=A0A853GX90_9BURK|nr:leucyl/phenylalanyl-tRNA--protein transferase [Pollutimonas harenae]NYT85366.1 leucyl/phenylalanyl-tRNA--protein transferase [Pollutimonas harenae]TEA70467.1 leucyl/phenylalanyl-tRNA--protein transferase [Pollutimonas harenae]